MPTLDEVVRQDYPNQPEVFYQMIFDWYGRRNDSVIPYKRAKRDMELQYSFPNGFVTYYSIGEIQNWECPICQNSIRNVRVHIDHSHKDLLVLGLLCANCNNLRRYDWKDQRKPNYLLVTRMLRYEEIPPAYKVGRFLFNPDRYCQRSQLTKEQFRQKEQKIAQRRERAIQIVEQWAKFGVEFPYETWV